MDSAQQNSVKAYLTGFIADAVQEDIVLEITTLKEENEAIKGFMQTVLLDTDAKVRAANALAEVLADNLIRIKQLSGDTEDQTENTLYYSL